MSKHWRSFVWIVLFASALGAAHADTQRSWHDGIPVQVVGSPIQLLTVRADWRTDFDFASRTQGPVYFNDCVTFVNNANVAATHIQFIFAAVDTAGDVKTPLLPLDVRYVAKVGALQNAAKNCRDHAYGNGYRGFWLVAWVNEIDFADGTSWHAPQAVDLMNNIRAALPASN